MALCDFTPREKVETVYKPANIKSMKEAAQRMLAGEVFYVNDSCKLYASEDMLHLLELQAENEDSGCIGTIFRCKSLGTGEEVELVELWRTYKHWQVKPKWYELASLSNPIRVMCWNNNNDEEYKRMMYCIGMTQESGKFIAVCKIASSNVHAAVKHTYDNAMPISINFIEEE